MYGIAVGRAAATRVLERADGTTYVAGTRDTHSTPLRARGWRLRSRQNEKARSDVMGGFPGSRQRVPGQKSVSTEYKDIPVRMLQGRSDTCSLNAQAGACIGVFATVCRTHCLAYTTSSYVLDIVSAQDKGQTLFLTFYSACLRRRATHNHLNHLPSSSCKCAYLFSVRPASTSVSLASEHKCGRYSFAPRAQRCLAS